MTAREDISLQLTLKVLDNTSFNSQEDAKTLPYEIFNSIYENVNTKHPKD